MESLKLEYPSIDKEQEKVLLDCKQKLLIEE